jgi:CDP-paratose synthetase
MQAASPSVLVIGATGYLGRHVCRLLNQSWQVLAVARSAVTDIEQLIGTQGGVPVSLATTSLEDIFAHYHPHACVNCAVAYQQEEPTSDITATNVDLPLQLVSLAEQYQCAQVVTIDTFFTRQDPRYPYQASYIESKREATKRLRAHQGAVQIINLQLEHMYGPGESTAKFLGAMVAKLQAHVPHIDLTLGEQQRDFIHVADVASAIDTLLHAPKLPATFQHYEVGTGTTHTVREVVERLKLLTQSSTQLNFGALPYRAYELMVSRAHPEPLFALGWKPQYDLEAGLKTLV